MGGGAFTNLEDFEMKMIESEETTQTLECERCGQPFTAQVRFPIPELNLTLTPPPPALCGICKAPVPEDPAEAEAQRQRKREAEWAEICPVEFRLRSESHGET